MPQLMPVRLLDVAHNSTCDAVIHSPIDPQHLVNYAQWCEFIEQKVNKRIVDLTDKELDDWHLRGWHWDWDSKAAAPLPLDWRTFSLVCENNVQGLMLVKLKVQCRLTEHAGKMLVYVDLLAAAPWNRPAFVASPRYKGVGSTMIEAAIHLSVDEEYEGRIGLHSLASATSFYDWCGMQSMGNDAQYGNLPYYEMNAQSAQNFLHR